MSDNKTQIQKNKEEKLQRKTTKPAAFMCNDVKEKDSVLDLLVPGLASDTSTSGPVAWERDW